MQKTDYLGMPAVDLHTHTNYTDAKNSIKEMIKAANEKKLGRMAITEHVRNDSQCSLWLRQYVQDVLARRENSDTEILLGFETKLLDMEGTLDIPKYALNNSELIICSLHRIPGIHSMEGDIKISEMDPLKTKDVYVQALKAICLNDSVDIIGHPFDLLYEHKVPLPSEEEMHSLAECIGSHGKVVEINTNYKVPPPQFLEICGLYDVLFSIGSDAHSVSRVGDVSWAFETLDSAHLDENNLTELCRL